MTKNPSDIKNWRIDQLSDIAGNNRAKRILQEQVRANGHGPNVLLTGDYGSCKTQTANLLIRTLSCENYREAMTGPCLQCANCKSIDPFGDHGLFAKDRRNEANGLMPAIHIYHFDCANVSREELLEAIWEAHHLGGRKLFYLDEVQHLASSKLDEKLAVPITEINALWLATGVDDSKLSPSFVRRFHQRYKFKCPTTSETIAFLSQRCSEYGIGVPDEQLLHSLALRSGNSISECISYLSSLTTEDNYRITVETMTDYPFRN